MTNEAGKWPLDYLNLVEAKAALADEARAYLEDGAGDVLPENKPYGKAG